MKETAVYQADWIALSHIPTTIRRQQRLLAFELDARGESPCVASFSGYVNFEGRYMRSTHVLRSVCFYVEEEKVTGYLSQQSQALLVPRRTTSQSTSWPSRPPSNTIIDFVARAAVC